VARLSKSKLKLEWVVDGNERNGTSVARDEVKGNVVVREKGGIMRP